jgi:hypothetical protein
MAAELLAAADKYALDRLKVSTFTILILVKSKLYGLRFVVGFFFLSCCLGSSLEDRHHVDNRSGLFKVYLVWSDHSIPPPPKMIFFSSTQNFERYSLRIRRSLCLIYQPFAYILHTPPPFFCFPFFVNLPFSTISPLFSSFHTFLSSTLDRDSLLLTVIPVDG